MIRAIRTISLVLDRSNSTFASPIKLLWEVFVLGGGGNTDVSSVIANASLFHELFAALPLTNEHG